VSEELSISREVEHAVSPVLEREGYELVLVEFIPRQHIVRLYVDREGGVSVEDCARVSHVVGDVLDAEGISDKIPGRYHLEVSSPGLDRPLVKPKDFRRFVGHQVNVTTREPVDGESGRKRFHAELAAADEREVRLVADGKTYVIAYELILRAKLVPEL
jgi:ribosome maturation factor RimP